MPLKIIRQDITKIKCDAIVNPTDMHYSHIGGTDAAIHKAAGEKLYRACVARGPLAVGCAVITPAYSLPCKRVIHTVGPVWSDGNSNEEYLLRSCYSESLRIASKNRIKSIAFPLISSGTFGFPKDRVLKIALNVIGEFLLEHEMLVYLAVYDKDAYSISEKIFSDIVSYIKDDSPRPNDSMSLRRRISSCEDSEDGGVFIRPVPRQMAQSFQSAPNKRLEEMLKEMDKSFAETLFSFIDEKGVSDVECYKRANVDKKTFSKIKCNKNYRPSKVTAVSFAIALRLNIAETKRLLNTAGMSLSRSNTFDIIIEYFITTGDYESIFDVNEVLYKFDQQTLGV